jgi:hypothetical protein
MVLLIGKLKRSFPKREPISLELNIKARKGVFPREIKKEQNEDLLIERKD